MAEESLNPMREVVGQFQSFFDSLTQIKKIILFSVLGVILLGLAGMAYLANRDSWTPIYSNISNEDAAVVKEKLDQNQIPVQIGSGGRAILVPVERADEARLVLAKERVTLGGGLGFADLFVGDTTIGETEFQQQVKFRIALEGELARMVSKLKSIAGAKVNLALPKKSLFMEDEVAPTASVVVDVAGGADITRENVATIGHLIANSVEGLSLNNVVVVDQKGKMLSRGGSDAAGGAFADQYSFRRNFEQTLEAKIISQLEPVVGPGRVLARVSADMEFDRITTKEEIFDPDGAVVRSEQTSAENSTGTRSIPVGVPGVSANLPETQAGASEVANVSQINKTSETRNFETSVRTVVSEPSIGKLKRLTVSVLMDGRYTPITDDDGLILGLRYHEWTTAEKDELQKLIRGATGFSADRGDTIELVNLRFQRGEDIDVEAQEEKTRRNRQFFLDILRYTFLGVGLLALILFVIRPMVQRLSAKPEDLDLLMGLPATIGELEGEELEIPTEREVGMPPRDKILEVARTDPLSTASLIRAWLREKR